MHASVCVCTTSRRRTARTHSMTTGRDGAADQSTVQSTAFAAPADAGSPSTTVAALAGTGSPSHSRGAMRLYSS
eukprot:scaffold40910_cov72-Phaeocystis_antarctica.AAC.6